MQLSLHLRSPGCLNTAYLFVFTIHTFIGDYRQTLSLLLLKIAYFNSPEPNLASTLIRKTIEPSKWYINVYWIYIYNIVMLTVIGNVDNTRLNYVMPVAYNLRTKCSRFSQPKLTQILIITWDYGQMLWPFALNISYFTSLKSNFTTPLKTKIY